jgi:hypothetical protein
MEFNLGEMRIFTTSLVRWIGPVEDPGVVEPPAGFNPGGSAQSTP